VTAENKACIISGHFVKTASIKDEWHHDVENPKEGIREIKASAAKIDLLKFWQRVPESEAKYDYYKEWQDVGAISIKSYDEWWEKQISGKTRNMVRKSQKLGVDIQEVQLTDELV